MAGKAINELPEITSVSDSSLMALSSDGKTLGRVSARTFKNSVVGQHISNYVRYLNQDIKLDLNGGLLTLKSGSRVFVPNGFESDGTTPKFDVITVASDVTSVQWGTVTNSHIFEMYNPSNNEVTPWEFSYSGSTAPTQTFCIWYDTTTNLVKWTTNGGEAWESGMALPLAISNYSSGYVTSIDQVFNGFGYIGSTIYALPGTVVSMPNGKEENGVLKNTEVEITSLRTVTLGSAETTDYIGYLSPNGIDYMLATNYYESVVPPTNKNGYALWLNTQDNHFYVKNFSVSGSEWELVDALGNICKFTTSSGTITKFESKGVLSLLDTNTFNLVPHIVETFISGTSWYRLYSDGWCEQGGITGIIADYGTTTVTLLKPFVNINYTITKGTMMPSDGDDSSYNDASVIRYATRTTNSFQIYNRGATNGGRYVNWKASGYVL